MIARHLSKSNFNSNSRRQYFSVDLNRRVATQLDLRTGTEVGVRAWPDEFNFHLHTIIYRLLEQDGERDYSGPFMINAEGIVRVAGLLDENDKYSFIIEALSSDGKSVQSEVQTLCVEDILSPNTSR